MVTLPVTLGDP